ncbi:hypothetical protein MPSEU_000590400 [Mayamaea pseudoterrestris]|nr:hypothetical protein MPSEU_000590400 [Mayamaea pseudoterrestris]
MTFGNDDRRDNANDDLSTNEPPQVTESANADRGRRRRGEDEEEKQEEQALVDTRISPETATGDVEAAVVENDDESSKEEEDEDDDKKISSYNIIPIDAPWSTRMYEITRTFFILGFVAFGGPQAHVALLRDHLVLRQEWLDEEAFLELFAIGQGLPGATSTQLVVSTALARAGPLGGVLAFCLWSLPGLIVLTVCGTLIATFVDPNSPPWWLIGLPPAAVSLVFKAFYGFALKLDVPIGVVLALFSCLVAVLLNNDEHIDSSSSQWVFPTTLAIGALVTLIDSKRTKPTGTYDKPLPGWEKESDDTFRRIGIPLWVGAVLILLWIAVLIVSIVLENRGGTDNNAYLDIFSTMYRIGSIIFGGGQVVLPMLQNEVVPSWMTKGQFFQGLGLAQSMPGPLFNFSAYLGAVYKGVPGALLAFVGLFAPGVLLIFAVTPFWSKLRHNMTFRAILKGLNATAIGLVGAACVTLWEAAISTAADAMVFAIAGTLAVAFNVPAPLCILAGGIVGAIMHPDAANLGQQPYCVAQGFLEGPEQ